MATFIEDYSISVDRTGSARVFQLVLTGWSNGSAWTEAGRLYWIITTGNAFELYRAEGKASGDKVASGAISGGVATLTADNTSGITGSVSVTHTAGVQGVGEVIVFYGDEPDMALEYKKLTDLLTDDPADGVAKWESGIRFELALKEAKRDIDNVLRSKLADTLLRNELGEAQLADIAAPRQLAKAHALQALALVLGNRGPNVPGSLEQAADFDDRAERKLKSVMLGLDFDNNDTIDTRANLSGGTIIRG